MSDPKVKKLLKDATCVMSEMKQFYDQVFILEQAWVQFYNLDRDDQYIRSQLGKAAEYMRAAHSDLNTITMPVGAEGHLSRTDSGRFALVGRELADGQPVEFLYVDENFGTEVWLPDRIIMDGDYRLLKRSEIPLEGLLVRIKV